MMTRRGATVLTQRSLIQVNEGSDIGQAAVTILGASTQTQSKGTHRALWIACNSAVCTRTGSRATESSDCVCALPQSRNLRQSTIRQIVHARVLLTATVPPALPGRSVSD